MKNKICKIVLGIVLSSLLLAGCNKVDTAVESSENTAQETSEDTIPETETDEVIEDASEDTQEAEAETEEVAVKLDLEDGQYLVEFDTDSTMFHVNETMNGKAVLTVENGLGTVHLLMPSKNVLNLYLGLVEDVEANEDKWIQPCTEEVTYEDGLTDEVYAYDVPVSVIGEEFDLALIGKKKVWYDHKVSVSNPQPVTEDEDSDSEDSTEESDEKENTIEVSLEGGTGKAKLTSPTTIKAEGDGYIVTIEWSSKHYDYMIVDGEKYLPVEVNETSIYEIPVKSIDEPLNVIADTVAMSTPHEIEYVITFDKDSMK